MTVSVSRSHFKKGFDDTLTLRNLRKAVGLEANGADDGLVFEKKRKPRSITVVRENGRWDVKRAS